MTANEIIKDIMWRIKDHKENIKWLGDSLKNNQYISNSDILKVSDEIRTRLNYIEALEMVLRSFNIIE